MEVEVRTSNLTYHAPEGFPGAFYPRARDPREPLPDWISVGRRDGWRGAFEDLRIAITGRRRAEGTWCVRTGLRLDGPGGVREALYVAMPLDPWPASDAEWSAATDRAAADATSLHADDIAAAVARRRRELGLAASGDR